MLALGYEEHRTYLEKALELFHAGAGSAKLHAMVWGRQTPVLEVRPEVSHTAGFVTKEVVRALRDLMDRAEIKDNLVATKPEDFLDEDPTFDEWGPSTDAAPTLGISVPSLHEAIEAGCRISKPTTEGGTR